MEHHMNTGFKGNKRTKTCAFFKNMEAEDFLRLLINSKRFISNSSFLTSIILDQYNPWEVLNYYNEHDIYLSTKRVRLEH